MPNGGRCEATFTRHTRVALRIGSWLSRPSVGEPKTIELLRDEAEAAALRASVDRLEAAVAKARSTAQRRARVIAAVPGIVWESVGVLGQPDYRITYVGGQLERILGYTPEEWTRDPTFWLSVVHPDDLPAVRRGAEQGGRLPEHRFLSRDGLEVWVMPHVRILRDAAGERIGTSIFVMDVTERVRAERARKEILAHTQALTRRLENLVMNVPGVVWESRGSAGGPLTQPVFFSNHLTTLTGYLPAEAVETPAIWDLLAHPDDREYAARELAQRLEQGGGTLEYRWLTRDGRTLHVESHVHVIRGPQGEVLGASGFTMDVTARKLAEDEQERLENEVLEAQARALAELSTPLIPLSSEVLVMPLVGVIDAQRAQSVIEVLLHGIRDARARVAILDVTGVPSIDVETADALLRAAHAVRLLGAEAVLAGIRPEVSATLVKLGTDLHSIATCRSLETAIAYAARRLAIAPRTVT
jgi:PAS domain S-box-containing protein